MPHHSAPNDPAHNSRPARAAHVQFSREPTARGDDPRPSMSRVSNDVRRSGRSIDLIKEEDGLNEGSPLLAPRRSKDLGHLPPLDSIVSPSESGDSWIADAPEDYKSQESKSSWYMFLLTFCMLG